MLAAQNIISGEDAAAILGALTQIEAEIEAGEFSFSRALEDIHLNIEARLTDIIGRLRAVAHGAVAQ